MTGAKVVPERFLIGGKEWILPPAVALAAADGKRVDDDVEEALHVVLQRRHGGTDQAEASFDDGECEDRSGSPGDVVSLEEDVVDLD